MINRPALYASVLALGASGAALAESHDDMAGMSPLSMTCSDVADMDDGQAEGAIYFIAGYEYGQGFGTGAMGATGGLTGVTGTAATVGEGATGAAGTGTAGTTLPGAGTDTTAGAATGTAMPGQAGAGAGEMVRFEDIDVADILSACEDNPDQLASAVVREHAGGSDTD